MRDFYITKVGSDSLKFAQQLKQPTTIQLNALKQACLAMYKTYSEKVISDFKKNFGDKQMTLVISTVKVSEGNALCLYFYADSKNNINNQNSEIVGELEKAIANSIKQPQLKAIFSKEYAPASVTATSQELGYTSYRKVREDL